MAEVGWCCTTGRENYLVTSYEKHTDTTRTQRSSRSRRQCGGNAFKSEAISRRKERRIVEEAGHRLIGCQ